VVECFALNPCWNVCSCIPCFMCGRSAFSSVLAIGESSAIGLYDVPWL